MSRGHWCFSHEKFMSFEVIQRTCKPKGHDIDYEDSYHPPIKKPGRPTISSTGNTQAAIYAQLVSDLSQRISNTTPLVYLQKEDNFYYWNFKAEVWQTDGMSFIMTLFNQTAPRIIPNKPKVFHDCVFQLKCDVVRLPRNFKPNPLKIYFKNYALNLETLDSDFKKKDDNIQILLETQLDLRAPPPKVFLNALKTALPDPQELYDCLQALSSVLLVRTQRIEKAFFFLGSGGNGKCQKGTDLVLMDDGSWKQIKDVRIGDKIISPQPDGSSIISNVVNTHSRFENDVYDVMEYGRRKRLLYTCASNHEIPIIRTFSKRTSKNDSTPRYRERKLFNYEAKHLAKLDNKKSLYCGFTTTAIEFDSKEPIIDPYLLGVYLGDGNSNTYYSKTQKLKNGLPKLTNNLCVTSADNEIINQLNIKWSSHKSHWHGKAQTYRLSVITEFTNQLKNYDLWGKLSGSKFIPKDCLLASKTFRIRLLDGLLDTDGFVDKQGAIWFTTKSLQLALNVEQLVFSLGGFASIRKIKKTIKSINFIGEYYEVSIQFNQPINKLISRKQQRLKPKQNDPRHVAIKCVKTNPQMVYGIEIDSPSHWYITNNWMVTHNSTIMKVVDNIFQEYIAHVDMLDLQKDGFSKTALVDKLANSFSEISKMKQKDIGVFKAIATGDIQSVNSKFKDRFDSVIKLIQFYSSNQMPEIEDINEGFIRRAHPIEFNQKIKEKDPYIDDKLNESEERKRILALLVRIARTTKRHGFLFEKTMEEKATIMIKQTHPILGFLNANIIQRNPKYTIKKKELHLIYSKWCKEKGYQPVNPIAFSKFLTKEGFLYAGRNEDPHWIGLGLPPVTEGQKVLVTPKEGIGE